jgi:hypothetical protein
MTDMWRTDWVKKKEKVAAQLANGQCGGSYGDAALILCSCLSALAAEVWPGHHIDRNRFVELLEKRAPPQLGSARVSIPLLVDDLRSQQRAAEASKIESKFLRQFSAGQILRGDEVDEDEHAILAECGSITRKYMRGFSYANLLYREVRSAYTHEGKTGDAAKSWPQTGLATHVSYVNCGIPSHRLIHFHFEWIAALTEGAAKAVDRMTPLPPFQPPTRWWPEG